MNVNTNSFPFYREEPRTNLLRYGGASLPFYYEAHLLAEEYHQPDRVDAIREVLARRAFQRDIEQFTRIKVNMLACLLPEPYVIRHEDGSLEFSRWQIPEKTMEALKNIDAVIDSLARSYGLQIAPKQDLR